MAYKQSPGRQMMPKTGAGIPPVLMCGSPMKQGIEYPASFNGKMPSLPPKKGSTSTKTKPTAKRVPARVPAKDSPMKQELTREGAESRAKVLATEKKRMKAKDDGIVLDPKSGVASAKPYPKKFLGGEAESSNKKVPTGKRTNAMIVDGSGQMVKEAKRGQKKSFLSNEDLYREYKRDSINTMNSRNKEARFYNVQSGKANPNAEELASGQNRGFFKK